MDLKEPGTREMSLEHVYGDAGGLGWFQFRHIVVMSLIKGLTGWSMMIMAFAGLVPDYFCLTGTSPDTENSTDYSHSLSPFNMTVWQDRGNNSVNVCDVNSTVCSDYEFQGSACSVVSEWDLVCDRKWIKPTITSVQMAGVLVGAVLAGQSGDSFGRRQTNFGFFLLHTLLNVVAGFSNSWQMFLVLRFFIGFCIESPRWLAVHGRLDEAYSVVERIASVNGTVVPTYTTKVIEQISMEGAKSKQGSKKYSYLDILNGVAVAKVTIIFGFQWCAISFIFYGLSFGVSSFSGNLYLNIALMSLVELPACLVTFFAVNKLGRRPTTFGYFTIGCLAAFACVAVHYKVSGSQRGTTISALSLVAKMAISACWSTTLTWVVESYPTVTRSVGYGFVNMTARIGAIIAPFALDLYYNFGPSYITIAVLMVVCLGLTLLLPETKGKSLPDNVNDAGHHGNQSNDHRYGSVSQALDLHKSEHGVHTKLSPAEKNV